VGVAEVIKRVGLVVAVAHLAVQVRGPLMTGEGLSVPTKMVAGEALRGGQRGLLCRGQVTPVAEPLEVVQQAPRKLPGWVSNPALAARSMAARSTACSAWHQASACSTSVRSSGVAAGLAGGRASGSLAGCSRRSAACAVRR
jgi:hypothetical protein